MRTEVNSDESLVVFLELALVSTEVNSDESLVVFLELALEQLAVVACSHSDSPIDEKRISACSWSRLKNGAFNASVAVGRLSGSLSKSNLANAVATGETETERRLGLKLAGLPLKMAALKSEEAQEAAS